MQRISITNPQNIIDGTAKKYYFKLRNTGGPKGDKGDKGDTGQTGPQGPKGDAATVAVGSTTTLAVGQDATVENVGSIYNAVLNFGIPQGPQGPQGPKGDKGDTGAQGETGPRGPQGERGTNATVYVGTTTTTNPGTQARVYNSGTDSNAVLNFEIPRGDVGPMPTIAQTTGQSTTEVMSQKATTDALNTKQNTIDSSHKLSADLVTDTTTTNKFVTASDKTTWNAKQNALTAGDNITISGNTISATDTTYTAGNGLNLNGTEFSADTDVLATKEDLDDYYTKPEADNLLAPKLEAEVVAELPATGEEGKLYLTPKAHTTQTATGNPITATVAEEAGKIESFQLDGDTYQQTYTGKNLFDKNTGIVAGYTYSADGGLAVLGNSSVQETYIPVLPNTAYIMWTEATSSQAANFRVFICEYDSGKGFIQRNVPTPSTSNQNQIITTANTRFVRLCFSTIATDTLQLEAGSTATDYEPYVGGTPSPNPDYPQPIQTVTGEQIVTIASINLFDGIFELGNISTSTGTDINADTMIRSKNYAVIEGGENYTISVVGGGNVALRFYQSDGTFVGTGTTGPSPNTFTAPANAGRVRFVITSNTNLSTKAQCEKGNSATDWTPYFEPSNYPLDLGDIQLCGLGDDGNGNPLYKDRIYRDGEEWKIHKATTTKRFSGADSEGWVIANSGTEHFYYRCPRAATGTYGTPDNSRYLCCNYESGAQITTSNTTQGVFVLSGGDIRLRYGTEISLDDWKAKLSTTNMVLTYALATATDTAITDTELIAQLEAIRTAMLQNGANTITNTASGSNLAGDMEIGYYGFNPRNRYDKWLWLNINNNYEQIGS